MQAQGKTSNHSLSSAIQFVFQWTYIEHKPAVHSVALLYLLISSSLPLKTCKPCSTLNPCMLQKRCHLNPHKSKVLVFDSNHLTSWTIKGQSLEVVKEHFHLGIIRLTTLSAFNDLSPHKFGNIVFLHPQSSRYNIWVFLSNHTTTVHQHLPP